MSPPSSRCSGSPQREPKVSGLVLPRGTVVHHPVDAEPVLQTSVVGAPHLVGDRHLDLAALGERREYPVRLLLAHRVDRDVDAVALHELLPRDSSVSLAISMLSAPIDKPMCMILSRSSSGMVTPSM